MNLKVYKIKRYIPKNHNGNSTDDFDTLDKYITNINQFIYNDIALEVNDIKKSFQSRLQILISSVLFRSIYLKEGIITSLNNDNLPSVFSNLKSFLEIPALLGHVYHILENSYENLNLELSTLYLGNKNSNTGLLAIGKIEQKNILTMLEKADKEFLKIEHKDSISYANTIKDRNNYILTMCYADSCNFSHINWNAHAILSHMNKEGNWSIRKDLNESKKVHYSDYMNPLLISIIMIEYFLNKIVEHNKVKKFDLLDNSLAELELEYN